MKLRNPYPSLSKGEKIQTNVDVSRDDWYLFKKCYPDFGTQARVCQILISLAANECRKRKFNEPGGEQGFESFFNTCVLTLEHNPFAVVGVDSGRVRDRSVDWPDEKADGRNDGGGIASVCPEPSNPANVSPDSPSTNVSGEKVKKQRKRTKKSE